LESTITVIHDRIFDILSLYFGRFTKDHKDILTLLIDKKCDVNISDNNSQTPLHIASYKGNVALVEILLRNKCVVDQCDDSNKTPFFLACEERHKDVVKSLINYNCNMDMSITDN
jgi:ankyrin repeat protein